MNDEDDMLEAVLEISRQEAALSVPAPMEEDKPTFSPDTGFEDEEAHGLAYHAELLEAEGKQPAGRLSVCLHQYNMLLL